MNTSCRELKRIARENLTHRYSIPMGALLIAGMIPLAIELPFSMVQGAHPGLVQNITFYTAEFLIALISYLLNAGVTSLHLNLARRKPYSIQMVFCGFKERPDRLLAAGLIELVPLLAALAPFLAGIHFLRTMEPKAAALAVFLGLSCVSLLLCALIAVNLGLMIYFVIDHSQTPVFDCLKDSIRCLRGHRGRLFYIYLSFIGLRLLSVLSLGIGSLWVGPYQSQTMVSFYQSVTGELDADQTPASDAPFSFSQYV